MVKIYDMHVATESNNDYRLGQVLGELGFIDDNLVDRRIVLSRSSQKFYTACPLIATHVSRKIDNYSKLKELELCVDQIMIDTKSVGYWHSEYMEKDRHIKSTETFKYIPFPFYELKSEPRKNNKVWDIHLAVEENLITNSIVDLFVNAGIYYLSRWKSVDGDMKKFSVFTVQGVSSVKEGRSLFTELCKWIEKTNFPTCDIKLEITIAMKTYNSPINIPPAIENVYWR